MRPLSLLIMLLLLAACSGSGSAPGGQAAPAPGPAGPATFSLEMRVQVPQSARVTARTAEIVTVEVVNRGRLDPTTLSGFEVVARAEVAVQPGSSVVIVRVDGIPPGTWHVYAFGRTASGNVTLASNPVPLTLTHAQLVTQTVELLPVGGTSGAPIAVQPGTLTLPRGISAALQALSNGVDVTAQTVWSSSDPNVATVSAQGVVTAVNVGTATITASFGGNTAASVVTVTSATLVSLAINPTAASQPAGLTQQFTAVGTFTDGTTQDVSLSVTWTSSNPAFATVNASGLATALTPGLATLTATLNGIAGTADFTVLPARLLSLSVTPAGPFNLSTGVSRQLTATGTFTDGVRDVTGQVAWLTSDPNLALISNPGGLATATGAGNATITATLDGISATSSLTGVDGITFPAEVFSGLTSTGGTPGRSNLLAGGDFNGDGLADHAVLDTVDAQLFVFQTAPFMGGVIHNTVQTFTPGFTSTSIASGDFNGDGNLDLVTGDPVAASITFYAGLGDGTFNPPVSQPLPGGAANVFVGVTGGQMNTLTDNIEDVLISESNNNRISLALGSVGGPVGPLVLGVTSFGPAGILSADYNNDTFNDAAVACKNGDSVDILAGDGNGGSLSVTTEAVFAPGSLPTEIAQGDLEKDGDMDLAVVCSGVNQIGELRNNGVGNFAVANRVLANGIAQAVALGDITGDTFLDLIFSIQASGTVEIAENDGTGNLPLGSVASVGSLIRSILPLDTDNNGTLDLFFGASSGPHWLLEFGQNSGFLTTHTQALTTGALNTGPSGVAAGDVDADGDQDVLVSNENTNTVSLFLNAAGTLPNAPSGTFPVGSGAGGAMSVRAADFNRDGRQDFVVGFQGAEVSVRLSDGAGGFPTLVNIAGPGGSFLTEARAADLNNDLNPDIVATDTAFGSNRVVAFLGDGAGNFGAPITSATSFHHNSIAVGDLNRDGIQDVVCALQNASVEVCLGNGNGTFNATNFVTPVGPIIDVQVADFNRDGNPDVAAATFGSNHLYILNGDGAGNLAAPLDIITRQGSTWLLFAVDFDLDQRMDLVVQDFELSAVELYKGAGNGTFTNVYSMDGLNRGAIMVPINADVRPDLITVGNGATNNRLFYDQQFIPFP